MFVEEIFIKKMTNEDINDIVKLEKMCFTDPWTETMFTEELKHENVYYFMAVNNKQIIGYTGFWHIVDEGHITNICVAPGYQKNGIGKKIMMYALEQMKALSIVATTLEVRESNDVAIQFYQKLGFQKEGIRKNYYTNPQENAIIMWKKLDE